MNSNQKGRNRLENTFSESISQAKDFLRKEKKQNKKKVKQITNCFYQENINHMFETQSTILRNQDSISSIPKDFVYYKLDVKYLMNIIGINLKLIDSRIISDKTHANILYIESYLNVKNSCIIFVEYHFKHIRLLSSNNDTDLNTFVFINSRSDIYYYDGHYGCILLGQYETNINVNCAKEILNEKQFKVFPADERTYELTSSENSEKYEKKNMKDIHLIPKQLFDILIDQYKYEVVPNKSELRIETYFIGITKAPISVQTKVLINYNHFGIIENSENLLEYKIILYFLSNPDKKVKAKFYLTKSEKNQYLILKNEYLKDAILEEFDLDDNMIKRRTSIYEFLYIKHCIGKVPYSVPSLKSDQSNIAKMFFESITVRSSLLEYPLLKDTFKNIYIETFNIITEYLSKQCILGQIRENKIEYIDEKLVQSAMYYISYQNNIYLIKVYSEYKAIAYRNNSFILYLPKFNLSKIQINIFKPFNIQEIDKFIEEKLDSDSLKRLTKYNSIDFNFSLDSFKLNKKYFETAFSDFDIIVSKNQNSYTLSDCYSNSIYKNVVLQLM